MLESLQTPVVLDIGLSLVAVAGAAEYLSVADRVRPVVPDGDDVVGFEVLCRPAPLAAVSCPVAELGFLGVSELGVTPGSSVYGVTFGAEAEEVAGLPAVSRSVSSGRPKSRIAVGAGAIGPWPAV